MSAERRPEQFSIDDVVRTAKEVALEYGNHAPTIIAHGEGRPIVLQIQGLPGTHQARREMMQSAGFSLSQNGEVTRLKQVYFVSEAWMSVAQDDRLLTTPPSQDPQRIEVLIISSIQLDRQRSRLIAFEMVRDSEERLTELRELETYEGPAAEMESPLLDAFVDGFKTGRRRFN